MEKFQSSFPHSNQEYTKEKRFEEIVENQVNHFLLHQYLISFSVSCQNIFSTVGTFEMGDFFLY